MTTTIQIDGIAELQKKLNTMTQEFAGMKPGGTMYNAMKRSVYMVVFTLADYPRQRPPIQGPQAQRVSFTTKSGAAVAFTAATPKQYKRTGTLGRRWTSDIKVTPTGNGMQGRAGNNTEYGPWVQSEQFQTAFHRETGWITDRQALDKRMPAIVREFNRAVQVTIETG